MTDAELSARIRRKVTDMINLKTSTLSEINIAIREMETKKDEDYEKELEYFEGDKRYLEYFKEAIKHDKQKT